MAVSGGYSSWAAPTVFEYVNNGVLITGEFGNPGGCGEANKIFISRDVGVNVFNSYISLLLAALTAQKEVRFRSDSCFQVTYHGQNVSQSNTAIYIRN